VKSGAFEWTCTWSVRLGVLFRLCKEGKWQGLSGVPTLLQVLATLMHANHLEREYGAGPHTISVPRMRPADGSDVSVRPAPGRICRFAHGCAWDGACEAASARSQLSHIDCLTFCLCRAAANSVCIVANDTLPLLLPMSTGVAGATLRCG